MNRYEIRAALPSDEEALLALARHLNSVNLPNDRAHVRRLLDLSEASFSGRVAPPRRRYVFVLWDHERDRAAGTSMIIAQLGHRDAPYIYFDVIEEERYSKTLDRHFHHTLLRIGFSYDGPTEIGGLVVDPTYRRDPRKLGLLVSYVRFLFIAARRSLFQDDVVAELLPPLEADGTSPLWEALGRHFTGLSYSEADLLSSENKDFVRDLFPSSEIYASVLEPRAQAAIGKVGADTKGVEKMLSRIGFRYDHRVDPFDGGPHFRAATDEITLVRETRPIVLGAALPEDARHREVLLGTISDAPPFFRAVPTPASVEGRTARVPRGVMAHLGLSEGAAGYVLPLRSERAAREDPPRGS